MLYLFVSLIVDVHWLQNSCGTVSLAAYFLHITLIAIVVFCQSCLNSSRPCVFIVQRNVDAM